VQTNFVEEGSILDSGMWVTLETSNLKEEARQFIDYASQPDVQDAIARNLYTSPTIKREHSSIDAEMYDTIAAPVRLRPSRRSTNCTSRKQTGSTRSGTSSSLTDE